MSLPFFQLLLNTTEWVIYLDSDTLALTTLSELWSVRSEMNASQAVAAAYNDLRPNIYHKPQYPLPIVPPWGMFVTLQDVYHYDLDYIFHYFTLLSYSITKFCRQFRYQFRCTCAESA